jgi:hypothetical protein
MTMKINTRYGDPKINVDTVDIAFAPSNDFTVKAEVSANGKIVKTIEPIDITRFATFARVRFKGNEFQELGSENGPRAVVIYVNDKPAGKLDMTFTKKANGDPYNPVNEWTTTGPWQTHAYFEYSTDKSTQQRVDFFWWMSSREIGPEKRYKVDVTMRRGTTILAKSSQETSIHDTELVKQNTVFELAPRKALYQKDLDKMAGPFLVEFKVGSKVIRTYRGEIVNGTFKPHKRSELTHTDPITFLNSRFVSSRGIFSEVLRSWVTTN